MDITNERLSIARRDAIAILADKRLGSFARAQREEILLGWWQDPSGDIRFANLPENLKYMMCDELNLDTVDSEEYNPLLLVAIRDSFYGMSNEYLKREIRRFDSSIEEVFGCPETMFTCQCCFYRSLRAVGIYEVCPVCFLEDDRADKDLQYSSPNHMFLKDAKSNVLKYGVCDPKFIGKVDLDARCQYASSS